MANERWESPFRHTIAFVLFSKHFTELNRIYWAHVPAANTIEKIASKSLGTPEADPKSFFLIHDDDDHRVASTYSEWKSSFRLFSSYTRANMLMLLSSCLETYLRTIVSLALESKPGLIISCPDAIDGVFLLKTKIDYGVLGSRNYFFSDNVDSICRGDWNVRALNYTKLFGQIPISTGDLDELNDLRHKRNLVGHYFGRAKQNYEAPISITPEPLQQISHSKLIKYFGLVYRVVASVDGHLQKDYIGSYDILKYYYQCITSGIIDGITAGEQARELQKILGGAGLPPVGNEYYRNLIAYFSLDNKDQECRYSQSACIKAINRKLSETGTFLMKNGRPIRFTSYHFNLFSRAFAFHENLELCVKRSHNPVEYYYSIKAINLVVEKINENPSEVFQDLYVLAHRDSL